MDKVKFEVDIRQICSNLLTDREFLEQLKDALEGIPTREEREQMKRKNKRDERNRNALTGTKQKH